MFLAKSNNPYFENPWTYYNYSKKLTQKAFDAKVKKVTKGLKLTKVRLFTNTAANRKAKLK